MHATEDADMSEDILKSIGELESVHIVETKVDMCVHNQLTLAEGFGPGPELGECL